MEIVGYNKDYIFTDHLNEATITCTYDELKEIAEYVTDSVNDDGIYHAFKHYHLI